MILSQFFMLSFQFLIVINRITAWWLQRFPKDKTLRPSMEKCWSKEENEEGNVLRVKIRMQDKFSCDTHSSLPFTQTHFPSTHFSTWSPLKPSLFHTSFISTQNHLFWNYIIRNTRIIRRSLLDFPFVFLFFLCQPCSCCLRKLALIRRKERKEKTIGNTYNSIIIMWHLPCANTII